MYTYIHTCNYDWEISVEIFTLCCFFSNSYPYILSLSLYSPPFCISSPHLYIYIYIYIYIYNINCLFSSRQNSSSQTYPFIYLWLLSSCVTELSSDTLLPASTKCLLSDLLRKNLSIPG